MNQKICGGYFCLPAGIDVRTQKMNAYLYRSISNFENAIHSAITCLNVCILDKVLCFVGCIVEISIYMCVCVCVCLRILHSLICPEANMYSS